MAPCSDRHGCGAGTRAALSGRPNSAALPCDLNGMGRSRAAGAFIAVLISGGLIDLAHGGDLVECEPQRVTGDGSYWAYRIVDSRECWYTGRPGKPKNELFWGRGTRRWTSRRPRPSHLSRLPYSRLRRRRNQRPPKHRRNGARPPPTSCSRSPAAGQSWRSPPCSHSRRPKKASHRPGRWPCYRSGSTRCGGLPSQDEDYGLFVPEMLAE